jgi:ADP-ribosyl-[dinitrogen reductase] hydrolase
MVCIVPNIFLSGSITYSNLQEMSPQKYSIFKLIFINRVTFYNFSYIEAKTKIFTMSEILNKIKGAIYGMAIGDSLGAPVEFMAPGTFDPVTDLRSGGPFLLNAGDFTDDTSMALCLANSLIEKGFDPADQLLKYSRWYREGYMSATGHCFDIGITTARSIQNWENNGTVRSPFSSESNSGNGSIMRLAPVPVYYRNDAEAAVIKSGESSLTTHSSIICVDACKYMGSIIWGALNGIKKETILSPMYSAVDGFFNEHPLCPEVAMIAEGSFKKLSPPQIKGSGYVVKSLEAALWAFYTTDNFEEGVLKAVNLGDDADTTGAVFGQIAGAFYGYNAIPKKWLDKISNPDWLEEVAVGLEK